MIGSCFGYFDPGNAAVVLFQFGTRVGLGHMVRSVPAGQTEPILGKRIPSDVIVFHRSLKCASAGCLSSIPSFNIQLRIRFRYGFRLSDAESAPHLMHSRLSFHLRQHASSVFTLRLCLRAQFLPGGTDVEDVERRSTISLLQDFGIAGHNCTSRAWSRKAVWPFHKSGLVAPSN